MRAAAPPSPPPSPLPSTHVLPPLPLAPRLAPRSPSPRTPHPPLAGQESIEILLNVMENNKEDLIVVLAGYQDKMERFYSFIPGMESRIGNHIEFPNYEVDELVEIGSVMCRELEYIMGDGAVEGLKEYLAKRIELPFFANARTVRNAIDLARMRAAIRIFNEKMADGSDGVVSEEELQTITGADIPELDEDALVMA